MLQWLIKPVKYRFLLYLILFWELAMLPAHSWLPLNLETKDTDTHCLIQFAIWQNCWVLLSLTWKGMPLHISYLCLSHLPYCSVAKLTRSATCWSGPCGHCFEILNGCPVPLFLKHGNLFSYLKSLFSYRDAEVPPVPSSMGLFINRSRTNCWIGS